MRAYHEKTIVMEVNYTLFKRNKINTIAGAIIIHLKTNLDEMALRKKTLGCLLFKKRVSYARFFLFTVIAALRNDKNKLS